MNYIWISWEESLFQKLLPQEPGILFSRTRILSSKLWRREFFWRECLIANLMDSIGISETVAIRIGNSFLKNENSFGRQWSRKFFWKEFLIANLTNRIAISETHVTRIRNFFPQERGFFLEDSEVEGSSWENFYFESHEKNLNFIFHWIRGRISYTQNFIELTFIANNFDNYRPNYLVKSDKALLQYNGGVNT